VGSLSSLGENSLFAKCFGFPNCVKFFSSKKVGGCLLSYEGVLLGLCYGFKLPIPRGKILRVTFRWLSFNRVL
jgi:hypothetical protein